MRNSVGVRALGPILLAASATLLGCDGESNLDRVPSSGFFNPPQLDYGVRPVGEIHELKTVLRNSSGTSLTVVTVQNNDFFKARPENGSTVGNLTLRPGSSEELTIRFSPPSEGSYDTTLVIQLLDKEIELPITASARAFEPAKPLLAPSTVIFTDIELGRDVAQRITVTNQGDRPGSLSTAGPGQPPFSITQVGGSPLPATLPALEPGESFDVELHFQPQFTDLVTQSIPFGFGTQRTTLEVSGTGNVPGTLSCNTVEIVFGDVPRGSTETRRVECQVNGGRYELAAIRFAPGSSDVFGIPTIPGSIDADRRLAFDVVLEAGGLPEVHNGRVEIVAAHNAIVSIPVSGTVAPPEPGSTDVSARMSWNTGLSDFDLHLVRSGRPLFERANDCYFENKNPDWGVDGYGGDDPFLDQDDTDGYGPEEVNLSFAAEATYDLYVQFYNYVGSGPPPTTVNLWLDIRGQPTQLLGQDLFNCGDTWRVGRVTFPVGGGSPSFSPDGSVTSEFRPYANVKCR